MKNLKTLAVVFLSVVTMLLITTGCGKKSEMQNVITRTESAINDMKNGKITIGELGEKLESIKDYCDSYKNSDETYESSLCISISLYEYEASMSAVSPTKKVDYQYWDTALTKLKDYKNKIK